MANVHGRHNEFVLGGNDLTTYLNNTDLELPADSHDTTTYGNDSHRKDGGLLDSKWTITGFYDNTASVGPRAFIEPLRGTIASFEHRPEGTGAGRPERTGNVLVQSYTESLPVADMVTFSVALEGDGDVTTVNQS